MSAEVVAAILANYDEDLKLHEGYEYFISISEENKELPQTVEAFNILLHMCHQSKNSELAFKTMDIFLNEFGIMPNAETIMTFVNTLKDGLYPPEISEEWVRKHFWFVLLFFFSSFF